MVAMYCAFPGHSDSLLSSENGGAERAAPHCVSTNQNTQRSLNVTPCGRGPPTKPSTTAVTAAVPTVTTAAPTVATEAQTVTTEVPSLN